MEAPQKDRLFPQEGEASRPIVDSCPAPIRSADEVFELLRRIRDMSRRNANGDFGAGLPATSAPAEMRIVVSSHPGPSFLDGMDSCCLRVMRNWLGKREVRSGVPAKVMARIIDTVRTLVLKPVYAEISMKQIAQMAQVREGTIYRLFGSRSGLSDCVRRHTLKRTLAITRQLVADRGTAGFTMGDVAVAVGLSQEELEFLFPDIKHLLEYVLGPR